MTAISRQLMQASAAEISAALQLLFDALPFQRGSRSENVAVAYIEALRGCSVEAVQEGVRKFLRGDCADVNPRYVPTPPELARIVRSAIVPDRIPASRQIAAKPISDGERERMRIKMPMWNYAFANGRMDELAHANREGFGAMIILATKWGVPIPDGLLNMSEAVAEQQWREARNRAWREIERNPPPFLRSRTKAGSDWLEAAE
jgi:hypothetical protein